MTHTHDASRADSATLHPNKSIDTLIRHYWDLAEHLERRNFPPHPGQTAPFLILAEIPLGRRVLYAISLPWRAWYATTLEGTYQFRSLGFLVLCLIRLAIWLFHATGSIVFNSQGLFDIPKPEGGGSWPGLLLVSFILLVLALPDYNAWAIYLSSLRSAPSRVFILRLLALAITLLSIVVVTISLAASNPNAPSPFPRFAQLGLANQILLLMGVLFMTFPAVTFLSFLLPDIMWFLVTEGRRGLTSFFYTFSITVSTILPFSPMGVAKISQELISPRSKDCQPWRLTELDVEEIRAIRSLAEANRNSTHMRLVPIAVAISVVALIADDMVKWLVGWLLSGAYLYLLSFLELDASPDFSLALRAGLALLAVGVFTFLFFLLLELPKNLVIQSDIVEASIAAEFAGTHPPQGRLPTSSNLPRLPFPRTLILLTSRFLALLGHILPLRRR